MVEGEEAADERIYLSRRNLMIGGTAALGGAVIDDFLGDVAGSASYYTLDALWDTFPPSETPEVFSEKEERTERELSRPLGNHPDINGFFVQTFDLSDSSRPQPSYAVGVIAGTNFELDHYEDEPISLAYRLGDAAAEMMYVATDNFEHLTPAYEEDGDPTVSEFAVGFIDWEPSSFLGGSPSDKFDGAEHEVGADTALEYHQMGREEGKRAYRSRLQEDGLVLYSSD